MHLAKERPLVDRLLAAPNDPRVLQAVYDAMGQDAATYAALLVSAAEQTGESAAASHWLTEAARVKQSSFGDDRGAVELLEAALERDPLNLRATEILLDLYRIRREDTELARVLRRRADWLKARYESEPVPTPRAALAFEKLSGVYEELGDSEAALESLRRAFEFERARNPNTTPSPPEGPRESSLRAPGSSAVRGAPPPEPRWSMLAVSESRDTMPSPIPPRDDSSPESAFRRSLPPDVPPGDPLLEMVEALHGLWRSEDVMESATFVLETALKAIPAAAGWVHVVDDTTRDFVVVAASGTQGSEVLGTRASEADSVIARAQEATQAVVLSAAEVSTSSGKRWSLLAPLQTVLCAPVQFDGRTFGAIELVDPLPARTFRDADRHAMTYVGERLGEFLADRNLGF